MGISLFRRDIIPGFSHLTIINTETEMLWLALWWTKESTILRKETFTFLVMKASREPADHVIIRCFGMTVSSQLMSWKCSPTTSVTCTLDAPEQFPTPPLLIMLIWWRTEQGSIPTSCRVSRKDQCLDQEVVDMTCQKIKSMKLKNLWKKV